MLEAASKEEALMSDLAALRTTSDTSQRDLREELSATHAASRKVTSEAAVEKRIAETALSRIRVELRTAQERGRNAEQSLEQVQLEKQELQCSAVERGGRVGAAQSLLEGR